MRRPAANLSVLLSILSVSCAARHVAAPQPPGMPIDEGRRTEAYFKRARSKESESARAEDKRYDQLCSKFQQAIYALMIDEKYGDCIDLMNRQRDRIDSEDLYWGRMRGYRLGELPYWMGHCHQKLGNGIAAYYWLKICTWNCWGSWDARASRLQEKVVAEHGDAIAAYEKKMESHTGKEPAAARP